MTLSDTPALFIGLYTDEDVTTALAPALRRRGYHAQSTVEAGNIEASDEAQLVYAAEQGLALLTYNAEHFITSFVVAPGSGCWHNFCSRCPQLSCNCPYR
jgi:hypothetical protein